MHAAKWVAQTLLGGISNKNVITSLRGKSLLEKLSIIPMVRHHHCTRLIPSWCCWGFPVEAEALPITSIVSARSLLRLDPAYTMDPLRSAGQDNRTRQSINPSVRPAVTLLLTDACLTPAQSGHPGNSPVTSTNFHPAQIFEIAKFHVMWDGKPAAVRSLRLTGGVETYRVGV